MAVDMGLPSGAHASAPVERRVSKKAAEASGGRSERVMLAVVCLVQAVWVAAVIYGAFQAKDFLQSLL